LASNAIADGVAEDAVKPKDGEVTVAAADVDCCDELNSCSLSRSLKFFGFVGDRLAE